MRANPVTICLSVFVVFVLIGLSPLEVKANTEIFYSIRQISNDDLPGRDQHFPVINEKDEVLWTNDIGQLYFYNGGQPILIPSARYGQFNDHSEIVGCCPIFTYTLGGTPKPVMDGFAPHINNRGQLAFFGGSQRQNPNPNNVALWFFDPNNQADPANPVAVEISMGYHSISYQINEKGEVYWATFGDGEYHFPSPGTYNVYIYSPTDGSSKEVVKERPIGYGPLFNNLGQMVWVEYDAPAGISSTYFYDGSNVLLVDSNSRCGTMYHTLNDSGQLVWAGDCEQDGTSEIYLYDVASSNLQVISSTSYGIAWPQINNQGQVAWYGYGGPLNPVDGISPTTEIYLYSGGTVRRVTHNTCNEDGLQINDRGSMVWHASCNGQYTEVYLATQDLVAYYPFNGNADDESGNGHHGTAHGADLAPDRCGNPDSAYQFNGTDDWISAEASPGFGGMSALTLSAWIHPAALNREWDTILDTGTNDYLLAVYTDTTTHSSYLLACVNNWHCASTDFGTITRDQWQHVAFTWEGTAPNKSQLYINGQPVVTHAAGDAGSHVLTTYYPLNIGYWGSHTYPYNFTGLLDEIYIYRRALNETEIAGLSADCHDLCPNDPNKTAPGACGCGVADTDTDGDGVPDCNDGCPNDPNKTAPGLGGCGVADTDTDGDGIPDGNDGCPNDPNKTAPGACGCGVADTDTDGDGVPDCKDACPNDPGKTEPGICGCGAVDGDAFSVSVTETHGKAISGAKVYAFTASGKYLGSNSLTDSTGLASFGRSLFAQGTYKFRLDYLGQQFWSQVVSVPGTCSAEIVVPEETTEVTVTAHSAPAEGVKAYVFSGAGSYLGLFATTNAAGKVQFDLPVGKSFKFRADMLGNQYWSGSVTISSGGVNGVSIDARGGTLQLTVQRASSSPMEGIKSYLFNSSGSYLGLQGVTDSDGRVEFDVSEGTYKVRADYLGYQFWSSEVHVETNASSILSIEHSLVQVTVSGQYQGVPSPVAGVRTYLFTPSSAYLGLSNTTNGDGMVFYDLPGKTYKVRADYMGKQFWSPEFSGAESQVSIPMSHAEITVTGAGLALAGVRVYAFSPSKSYLGLYGTTNASGKAAFRLPAGDTYWFRADYEGSQFWGSSSLVADQITPITISTGGGTLALTVIKRVGDPLSGVKCYAFKGSSYLGISGVTSSTGQVDFNLADGVYKIRADYLGYQFWTDELAITESLGKEFTIVHEQAVVTVQGALGADVQPRPAVPAYLFHPSGQYLGVKQSTNASGQAVFDVPEAKAYSVRADYLGGQFWSQNFAGENVILNIPEGMADVRVVFAGQSLVGVPVYVFSGTGSYLGLNGKTDVSGFVSFRLPAATYQFRADYQGSQFWATASIARDVANVVPVNTGGGQFVLTVDTGQGALVGAKVYAFKETGTYLGLSGTTDGSGQVSFNMADGRYKFRVDHMGYQFWSSVYEVPISLSGIATINHKDVTVTVEGLYVSPQPLEGIKVYLFTPSGSYLGQYRTTDANGQVVFTVPNRDYKVRADYLGYQFWSQLFNFDDSILTVNEGRVGIHVSNAGGAVSGAKVYLFSPGGSYLGKYQTTSATGNAEFVLPDKDYKFRVDVNGKQYWSKVVTVPSAGEVLENVNSGP